MTSSRANAETWGYPRHRDFVDDLQAAASKWFEKRGLRVRSDSCRYILADHTQWAQNIILGEVADYVQRERAQRQVERRGFPLHGYLHHGLSSQAMLFNLVGPLIVRGDLSPLREALVRQGIACPAEPLAASLEHEDRDVFREDTGQPTSLDLMLEGAPGTGPLFVEAKLVEAGFGGCSVFAAGDCDGRNPARDRSLCYLNHLGRRYWDLLDEYGFLSGRISEDTTCILATHYQFFREVLFSLKMGGTFVLLSDERSPTFHCRGDRGHRGLMPLLLSLMPLPARGRVATVTIQQVVAVIKASRAMSGSRSLSRSTA